MAYNDLGPHKLVKICPDCSYKNDASLKRCSQCDKSLAGIQREPEALVTDLSQQPLADETFSDTTITENPPIPQTDTQHILPGNQTATSGLAPDMSNGAIPTEHSVSAPLSVPPYPSQTFNMRVRSRYTWLIGLLLIILVFIIIVTTILVTRPSSAGSHSKSNSSASSPNIPTGLGEFKASNGQLLGINDGSFAPFLLGPDGQLKQQAVAQLNQHDSSQAISLWNAALHITNNDAEAWIYLENQSVLLSGLPYVTLVAGTNLFESQGSSLSALRGVYISQHEFNSSNHGFRVRILIANSGTDTNNVSVITQMIANVAKQDKTVVGVISWLTSTENVTALKNLSAAHIPMISPDAASDTLTGVSPYFFRIIAPTKVQSKQSALFAEKTLHAKRAVIFADDKDSYSQNAAQVFENQFEQDGKTVLKVEPFITGKMSNIKSLIQDALTMKPDLLLFTSRDGNDDAIFQDALPTSGPFANLPVLVGGAGYVIHKAGYGRWYLNADAFPDASKTLMGNSSLQFPFYQDYSSAFNEDGHKPAGYYGNTRPDSYAMLSYDVTSFFLKAIQQAIANTKITIPSDALKKVTPVALANTLPTITLQGVSGWIAFDSDHNPINKTIIFIGATSNGFYIKDWRGCFTKDICQM